MTPEAFFRKIDLDNKLEIKVTEFKRQIKRLKLPLAKRTVNRLIAIFDEDINGYICIEEYYNTLYAYNCLGEVTQGFDEDINCLSYTTNCVYKLVQLLEEKKIGNDELFALIDTDGSGTIDTIEMKLALKSFDIFTEKELFSIRNYFNVDKNGEEIGYDEFLELLKQAQNIYEARRAESQKQPATQNLPMGPPSGN